MKISVSIFFAVLAAFALSCSSKKKVDDGGDPWFKAARLGDIESLKSQMAAGKAVDAKSNVGVTALMVASRFGNVETIKWLLLHGANARAVDGDKQSALAYALADSPLALPKRTLAVDELLKAGADPFAVDGVGFLPIREIVGYGMEDQVKGMQLTKSKPCDRMPVTKGMDTLSQIARREGHVSLAEYLEKQGCW